MATKVQYVPPEASYEQRPTAPRHSMAIEDPVVVRRTETSDAEVLFRLAEPEGVILSERFGSWNIPLLSETSLLAITAQDANDPGERACGFAAFSDAPNWPGHFDHLKWDELASNEHVSYNAANSMWLHIFFADHALEHDAANTVLSTAFATLSEVEYCLFALPSNTPLFSPFAQYFEEISRPPPELTNGKSFTIYMSQRHQFIPEMFIRTARVEDHDDLLPVFGAQAQTLAERYGDYGLSDVLASQSDAQRTLVAEVDGRAIGLISLNADVELIKVLGSCFELTAYDHLMKYPEGVIPPSLRAANAAQYDDEETQSLEEEEEEETDSESSEDKRMSTSQFMASTGHTVDDMIEEDSLIEPDALIPEGEEENEEDAASTVLSETSEMLDVEGMEPNAFAVTLFCIAEGFESRAYELLGPAFEAFPDRDFCLITLPHTSLEFPLLSHFNIVPPRFSGTFPQVLYVFHRHALLALHGHLSTRQAVDDDMQAAAELCSTLENGREVMDAFNLGLAEMNEDSVLQSFVAVADDSVAGLVVLETDCPDADLWRATYRLDDFIDWSQHKHCELVYFVVNPIFERSAKTILNATMRLTGKSVIHHRVFTDQPVVNILRDMIPVRPRKAIENVEKDREEKEEIENLNIARDEKEEVGEVVDPIDTEEEQQFALYFLAKKHITEQKVVVNARTVVIGASNTGIAFLEHLAFIPYLHFTSLTLVSEGGLPTGAHDHYLPEHLTYDVNYLHKLSLRSKIRVVDDKMIGIDREQQLAILPFDAIVPYDFLVLVPGLQDQTANALNMAESEYRGVFTLRNEHALDALRSYAPLRRPDAPRRSIVYGRSIDALCAVQGLIEAGEDPKDIVMCWPPHSPPFSDDAHVNKTITDTLAEINIRCYHDMTLRRAETERGRIFAAIFEPSARAGLLGPLPTNDEYADSGHDTPVVPVPSLPTPAAEPVEGNADLRLFCKNLLLCVGNHTKDLDPDTHQAIDAACLVYDGRLVVDGEFRTNDPHIFSGGSVARFSRRLGRDASNAYLDQFDPLEGGTKLAQALLTRVDPLSDGSLLFTESAPVFEEPTTTYCMLPGTSMMHSASQTTGNLHYFHAEQIKKLTNHPVTTEGRSLTTVNKVTGDYFDMFVDKFNRISRITYLGKSDIEAHNLRQLIGLPETLLNDLERRFDEGDVDDLPAYLRQPWTEAIYHDRFADFRSALGAALNDMPGWDALAQQARELVEEGKLDVINRKTAAPIREALLPATNMLIKQKLMEWLKDVRSIVSQLIIL